VGGILSIGTTPTIPAGWYQDPSDPNPSAQRWWDGVNWTGHVSSVTPPTPYAPYEQQALVSPRHRRLDAFGWIALALSLLDLGIIVVSLQLPAFVPVMIPVGILAVASAVTALVLRGKRKAASLVAPIIAIVLTVILSGLGTLAWLGQTAIHTQAEGIPVTYPNSAELATLFETTRTIERGIRAHGSAYHWPTSVTAAADGTVSVEGAVVAKLSPGQTMTYQITKGGEDFVLRVNASVPGEYFYYDLDTHEIDSFCYTTDHACDAR